MSITTPRPKRHSASEILEQIRANERLLALYDSPFPDQIERQKRRELREFIGLLRFELKSEEGQ